jgi:PAS domain S-box-containing protein
MVSPHRTLLLMDISDSDSPAYAHLLKRDGRVAYQLVTAPNADQVVPICRSQPISAILLGSSSASGSRNLGAFIQQISQLGQATPPVVVIGDNDAPAAVQALKHGAADYLVSDRLTAEQLHRSLQAAIALAQTEPSSPPTNPTRGKPEQEQFMGVESDLKVTIDKDGYFKWVSRSFEPVLGWSVEEMTARPWTDFVHPDDVDRSVAEASQVFLGDEAVNFENRYRHKNGAYRWVSWRAQVDPEQQLIYGAAVDITERKLAATETLADLQDMRRLHEMSVRLSVESDIQVLYEEIVSTAMALTRADGGAFQALDEETQELLLLATQGLPSTLTDHCARVSARSKTSCGIALASRDRVFVHYDAPHWKDADGAAQLYLDAGFRSAQSTPLITRSGQHIGMISTHWHHRRQPTDRELGFLDLLARQATDLVEQRLLETEREKLLAREQAAREEAEKANRIKDEFLAILSHELRSPLNPILGWSKLLQTRQFDSARTAQALATIERNAKLQIQLIDDLLDVARILRGKLEVNYESINPLYAVESAIEIVSSLAAAKSITIHPHLTDVGQISGDNGRLQQIVWNLLTNAIKFTPSGGAVSIYLEAVEDQAQITVVDTGKGISPEFLPRLFDAFLQEDVSITRQHGGLGLGLSIVNQLVAAHQGAISVDSAEGDGATFTVRLPLLEAESHDRIPNPLSSNDIDLTGVRVLAVDDIPDARELLVAVLEGYGAEVLVVSAAAELLTHLESFHPDIIVSDISMPMMDGYNLLLHVRGLTPQQGGTVPAIALTSYAGEMDLQRALDCGFQSHISKPLEPEKLALAIAQLV